MEVVVPEVSERVSPLTLTLVLGSKQDTGEPSAMDSGASLVGGVLVQEAVVALCDAILTEELIIYAEARNTHRLMARWRKDEQPYNQQTLKAINVYCEQVAADLYQEFRGSLVSFHWRAGEIHQRLNAAILELCEDVPDKKET